ncbi:polysaccharide deacetylase [Bosea caraganae]|uniref:Chitooligosaccharide deacetylase n=1 Tax=Bosea caraganae TaxID=2763117 RepID=A0A370L1N2_9HYPH|nr:polysaccharide deacetylase family protein [Bosea caraganae]RDJ21447.1 polysaccharide deacetylase [Bosea caraganae]RDJ23415.1 polysaccharide deacetylase [Bosea caraganae]
MSLLLTVNVHGIGPEAATIPEAEIFGRDAHGRYTYRIGLSRVLDALRDYGLKATFFWPSSEAQRIPALLERCLKDGHELASNGRAFEDHSKLGADEDAVIEEAHDLLSRLAGTAPIGFRSPTGTLSERTIPILQRLGYRYDSSFLDDDAPYSLAQYGGAGMVELPISEGLTDATHFRRRVTQDRAEALLGEELTALLGVDGYACLTFHPRADIGIGRAARLPMLERLVRLAEKRGATPVLCRDAAEQTLTN